MTTDAELEEILRLHKVAGCDIHKCDAFKKQVLALTLRHAPAREGSRSAISDIIGYIDTDKLAWRTDAINRICALLDPSEPVREWCKEIKWNGLCWMNHRPLSDAVMCEKVDDRIDFCQLCGEKRPEVRP